VRRYLFRFYTAVGKASTHYSGCRELLDGSSLGSSSAASLTLCIQYRTQCLYPSDAGGLMTPWQAEKGNFVYSMWWFRPFLTLYCVVSAGFGFGV